MNSMAALFKNWTQKCAMPGCDTLVSYHSKNSRAGGAPVFVWKMFCEPHRTTKKIEADLFKLARGCENKNGRYGFRCTTTIEHAVMLDMHHKDKNRKNSDESNLECLCSCCHRVVTLMNRDHLNTHQPNEVELLPHLFQVDSA